MAATIPVKRSEKSGAVGEDGHNKGETIVFFLLLSSVPFKSILHNTLFSFVLVLLLFFFFLQTMVEFLIVEMETLKIEMFVAEASEIEVEMEILEPEALETEKL